MENKYKAYLLALAIVLIIFAAFSNKVGFHDSFEFITLSKYFAGVNNMDLFSGHSLLYPAIMGLFLKIWPSFIMLNLVNALWIFLIGVILLLWVKNEKAFIIYAFSPLTWWNSIQTTPVLPAAFFFFISFLLFNKTNLKGRIFYAGLFWGLSCAFYTPMFLVGLIFIFVYFWKEPFNKSVIYLIAGFIGYLPRFIQDLYLFKNPFYSLIRYAGNNFIVLIGINPNTGMINILQNFAVISVVILISPFLFRLHRLNFKDPRILKLSLFLGISSLIFLLRTQQIKYFLIFLPILIILLSKVLTKEEFKWNVILSVILIAVMTFGFFTASEETGLKNDLNKIIVNYNQKYVVAGPNEAVQLSTFLWENEPRVIWFQDFQTSSKGDERIRGYNFDTKSRIPLKSDLNFSVNFERSNNRTYEDYVIVTRIEFPELKNFTLLECYEEVCIYK